MRSIIFVVVGSITLGSYALVPCPENSGDPNSNAAVFCIEFSGSQAPHYIQVTIGGNPAILCMNNTSDILASNENISGAVSLGIFHLGANQITFSQCDGPICANAIPLGAYSFTLNDKNKNGHYSATPAYNIETVQNYGATCQALNNKMLDTDER